MNIQTKQIGIVRDEPIYSYTLENDQHMQLACLNLGCIVTEIIVPDKNGNYENVVLGFNTAEEYLRNKTYFGALVGRVAGRIGGAEFSLNGEDYTVTANEGKNHLHGGAAGLSEKVWKARTFIEENQVGVEFTVISEDGEEGYPGNVQFTVTYILTNDNEWIFKCHATTDKPTLVNVTNHSYFNLSGNGKNTIVDHELTINSNQFLELSKELLPTGNRIPVEGTVFDLRKGRRIREAIESDHPQIALVGKGFDHPFILEKDGIIQLSDPESGRKMEVETNQNCVIVYTTNQVQEGSLCIKEGKKMERYLGICLETQNYPDAIHHSDFPSIVLNPGETYEAVTTYRFGVQK
mgnify:CR=1 FL=1